MLNLIIDGNEDEKKKVVVSLFKDEDVGRVHVRCNGCTILFINPDGTIQKWGVYSDVNKTISGMKFGDNFVVESASPWVSSGQDTSKQTLVAPV